jgi:hypothetical protein
MFLQVTRGAVFEAAAMRSFDERWIAELSPAAEGYLGSTEGVTADGTFVGLVRFESAAAASRNSHRPEQGAWWAETQQCFTGGVTFTEFDDVTAFRGGGSDEAGFVQVMLGSTADPARQRELSAVVAGLGADYRPDLLGGIMAFADDGSFVQAFYFTSEADARIAEQQDPPEAFRDAFAEARALVTELAFYDLTDPWLHSKS